MSPITQEYGLFDFADNDPIDEKSAVEDEATTSVHTKASSDSYLSEVDPDRPHPRHEGAPSYMGCDISWENDNGIRFKGIIRRSQYIGRTLVGDIPEFQLVAESNGKRFNLFMVRDYVRWED